LYGVDLTTRVLQGCSVGLNKIRNYIEDHGEHNKGIRNIGGRTILDEMLDVLFER
jgi:hypothetical protein